MSTQSSSSKHSGTLTYEEFAYEALSFSNAASNCDQSWESKGHHGGDIYLVKHEYKKDSICPLEEDLLSQDYLDDRDPQVLETDEYQRLLIMEYHVVYSHSYATPVLYFMAKHLGNQVSNLENIHNPIQDGSLLRVEEIWERVPTMYKKYSSANEQAYKEFANIITQMDHPILQKPYFAIHPCQTATFMKSILDSQTVEGTRGRKKPSYLLLWLSTLGPMIGLSVDIQHAKLLWNDGGDDLDINVTKRPVI